MNNTLETRTIKFLSNLPVSVRLNYDRPREIDGKFGKSFLYGCADPINGRLVSFFATEKLNELIQNLKAKQGDVITICKREGEGNRQFFEVESGDTTHGDFKDLSMGELEERLDLPPSAPSKEAKPKAQIDPETLRNERIKLMNAKNCACQIAAAVLPKMSSEKIVMETVQRYVNFFYQLRPKKL